MSSRIAARIAELTARGEPFVHATVVRAQFPTPARPGDDAIVRADGTVEGFVGGICAEGALRTAAVRVLDGAAPLLLRVLPEDGSAFPDTPGAEVVVNPCLSGGALEIFLEPVLPPPLVQIVGSSPIGDALERIAAVLGYDTGRSLPGRLPERTVAVVVCSHGRDETASIRAALDGGVGYVALVASRRRGEAVLDELALAGEQRKQVRTPAGLDLGARTAEEIALSIMAEIVQAIRQEGVGTPETGSAPPRHQAIDPVCGMAVTVAAETPHLHQDGTEYWFCSPHCRDTFSTAAGH